MSGVSDNMYCMSPFIFIQEEFGYSDVTVKNAGTRIVEEYFVKSEKRLVALSYLKTHFENLHHKIDNGK
ncbi:MULTISPECIES: hypothetical protein [Sphingobacterium]|uniref:hypothetical protein n=1 Tax=Sphingobacterium TaxID=28453 RepID=UPI00257F3F76|nr:MULTISPECIES: hypothetical protein [Sphingobacterium]